MDSTGNRLKIVQLRHPYDVRVRSIDFVASYVNYYVCNGAVIAAQFGDEAADAEAEAVLAELYPDREVVMLEVDPIGETAAESTVPPSNNRGFRVLRISAGFWGDGVEQ